MLKVNIRDVKKTGIITGRLIKNGRKYNIRMQGNDLDTIVSRSNLSLALEVKFEGEVINRR